METSKSMAQVKAIEAFLQKGMEKMMEEEWDLLKKTFVERIESRKAQIISSCAINVLKEVDFRDMGSTITITVKKE